MKTAKPLIIPYFISMQGCKNRCIYCNQHILKDHHLRESINDVYERYLGYICEKEKKHIELAFYGGTFLHLPAGLRKNLLSEAQTLKAVGRIHGVRISTTPDSVDKERCDEIKDIVDVVELGVQSFDDRIVRLLGRNYDARTVISATLLLRKYGFKVGHQLMAGLPFETFNSFKNTADRVCQLKPDFVRIYPLMLFRNTPIALYCKTQFVPLSQEQLVKRIAYAIYLFSLSNIPVIRVGLDSFVAEDDCEKYKIDNWKALALSFLWRELIKQKLTGKNSGSATVVCNPKDYEHIVGYSKSNLNYFRSLGLDFIVKTDNSHENRGCTESVLTNLSLDELNWSLVDIDFSC